MVPSSILAEMQATLVAGDPALTFAESEREMRCNGVAPQIVWVDARSEYGPSDTRSANPRALFTRTAVLDAHIWGRDRDDAIALLHAVVAAAHKVAYGSLEVLGDHAEQPDWMTNGRKIVLTLGFHLPVTAAPLAKARITHFNVTSATRGDGVIEPGDT